MESNIYAIRNLGKKLVQRSTAPYYKSNFALVTEVTHFGQFDTVTATMLRAAQSMPEPYFIHVKIETDTPADMVRVVPSILQSFNRTRTLRRQCVSGIRMCNLVRTPEDWHYISDMVVSCSFDAVALCAGLAEYASLGSHVLVTFEIPRNFRNQGDRGRDKFVTMQEQRFWKRSRLSRSAVGVFADSWQGYKVVIRFEPHSLSHIALLNYILIAFHDVKDLHVEVGRGSRLIVSRLPLWDKHDYAIFKPDAVAVGVRYRRAAAFGRYHHNPDYLLY